MSLIVKELWNCAAKVNEETGHKRSQLQQIRGSAAIARSQVNRGEEWSRQETCSSRTVDALRRRCRIGKLAHRDYGKFKRFTSRKSA